MLSSKDSIFSNTPNKITNDIYQGNLTTSENKYILSNLRITHILAVGEGIPS